MLLAWGIEIGDDKPPLDGPSYIERILGVHGL